jgi:pimeloyl-ACP methyl ester carboxylesterase
MADPQSTTVNHVGSKDGTAIAFERIGNGPALVLVDGALCHRGMGPSRPLAKLLASHFTVFAYDRRGRGQSGDTSPYSVTREIEDLEAVLHEAGGAAYVSGVSSGAVLALEAARQLRGIRKLALFEAPFIVDDSRRPISTEWARIRESIAAGRPGDAVTIFMKAVGAPALFVALMRLMPGWSKLKAVAHTLPYDGAFVQDNQQGKPLPAGRWDSVTVPTLVLDGGKSPTWMRHATRALSQALPNAEYRTLEGQTHMVKARAHAPVLTEFFSRSGSTASLDAKAIA